jgi:hypothetical protein
MLELDDRTDCFRELLRSIDQMHGPDLMRHEHHWNRLKDKI